MSKSEESPTTYRVCIEELLSQEFEIVADSYEAALEKAREGYRAGELVLEAGEVSQVQMRVLVSESDALDEAEAWVEL